ncbi:MAG: DUF3368 domain-containing protein [Thiohalomonadales bacterium]
MLQSLYHKVVITASVLSELEPSKDNTLQSVKAGIQQGWIRIVEVNITDQNLADMLDQGEASAITYSLEHDCIPLLIDEHRGKTYAKNKGIPVIGTAGILIQAKQKKLITLVKPLLEDMQTKGYWLSNEFIDTVVELVDE